jgi:TonB family protein
MTLWLSNLVAYSVQLAVLVGTAALAAAILRLDATRASLRFWQATFAASLLWPVCQVLGAAGSAEMATAGLFAEVLPVGIWSASSRGVAGVRAGLAAMDTGIATLLVSVVAAGAAVRIGWLGLGLVKLGSIRAASEPAHELSAVTAPLLDELGVTADIRFCDSIGIPATIGARHPAVLLPRHVGRLPLPVQRAVVCHELIHVRRRDWAAAVVEELWCAIFWFHPAARALASRLCLAREVLVDAATIAHTRDRRAYAAALLEFSAARTRLAGATALIGRRQLERRIALIAQEAPMPRRFIARIALAAVAAAGTTVAATMSLPIAVTEAQTRKIYRGDDAGITLPQAVEEVLPRYTAEAMQARIQGSVWVKAIVLESGDVDEVTVTKSLDDQHGLDQQAVDAARQWKFKPGTIKGKPVPVEITIEMTFTLK